MSIISKLKGAKKAADEHKAKAAPSDKPAPAPYKHVPTHAATDALTGSPGGRRVEDREQIRIQNVARLNRIGSDYSARPSTSNSTSSRTTRPGSNRANSDSSLDFTPPKDSAHSTSTRPKSSGSSLKSSSRVQSFQGLEKVLEDSNVDYEPVSAVTLLANRNRPSRRSRSPRNFLGKSPLSSVETSPESSPVDSEASSEASGSASGAIELRSLPVRFSPTNDIHPGQKVASMFPSQTERKYFHHKTPSQPTTIDVPAEEPVVKTNRFSFMKKSNGAVAAH